MPLSDENTYIYIADSNPGTEYTVSFTLTSTNTAYSVLTFHLKHYDVQSDNDIVSGGSLTLTSGTAVRIQISAEIQYSGSTVPTDIPMEFTVTSVQAHGTYLTDPGKSITLLAGNISIVEQIDNLNPGTDGGATFEPKTQDELDDVVWGDLDPNEYVITEIEGYGTSHPGCHAVDVLGNSDGVAKDGKANFSFRIPTNKMFVLELIPGSSLKSEKLALQVQYVPTQGEPTTYGMTQVSLNSGTAHSILCRNGTDIQVQSQVSNLAAQYWFPAMNSGSITIILQNQGNGNQKIPDDVHMYLVFRDALAQNP